MRQAHSVRAPVLSATISKYCVSLISQKPRIWVSSSSPAHICAVACASGCISSAMPRREAVTKHLREQIIADQNAGFVAPHQIGGGLAAPRRGSINDIVVQQSRGVR